MPSRIDVAAVFSGQKPRVARRRSLIDMRAFAPSPRVSTRHSRAVALADAAMIMALGDSPRARRRCAITVQGALDMLDAEAPTPTTTDAIDFVLARCGNCRRCGPRG